MYIFELKFKFRKYFNFDGFKVTAKIKNNTDRTLQGYNERKVISEVHASFVLQCTVSGR